MPVPCSQTASEPFVWAARPRKRRRKRGKRAGVLVRRRRRAFRPPLPTILLANVQSLDNKLCELRARISYQWENKGLLRYLPHRNLDVCNGSRLSHRAHGLLRALEPCKPVRTRRSPTRWVHSDRVRAVFLFLQIGLRSGSGSFSFSPCIVPK